MLLININFKPGPPVIAAAGPSLTLTPNRLAEPTLPPDPSQAESGAPHFWLYCMPCHGDRGQGLTDEFRQVYPEEDRNCWKSGCHGARPYENGFTLPANVPEIIGPGALNHFETAASLYTFISSAMPYQAPGSLEEKVYWQLTAFLLWKNGLIDLSENLDPGRAALTYLRSPAVDIRTPAPPVPAGIQATPEITGMDDPHLKPTRTAGSFGRSLLFLLGLVFAVAAIAWMLSRSRRKSTRNQ